MADFSKVITPYVTFIKNMGYQVFYNGCKPDDSEVFLVLVIPNKDNPNEFQMAFYNANTGAPLSLEGFQRRVLEGDTASRDEFAKDATNRIKGCIASKTDVVYCLLLSQNYTIDEVYGGGSLHLTPTMLKAVSDWVNYKGGRNPLTREQVRQRMNAK